MHRIWNISNIISHFLLVFLCKIFNIEKDKNAKHSSLILQDSLGVICKTRLIKTVKSNKYRNLIGPHNAAQRRCVGMPELYNFRPSYFTCSKLFSGALDRVFGPRRSIV
jgi:hypothetical protein